MVVRSNDLIRVFRSELGHAPGKHNAYKGEHEGPAGVHKAAGVGVFKYMNLELVGRGGAPFINGRNDHILGP